MVPAEQLKQRFKYVDGILYWRDGRFKGRVAGHTRKIDGYCQINFLLDDKMHRMLRHRIIFMMFHDYLPELVDHIDRDPCNDRIENLREANKSINAHNTVPRKNNRTGVKGVFKDNRGKYQASVYHSGKKVYLGLYDTLEEAKFQVELRRGCLGL